MNNRKVIMMLTISILLCGSMKAQEFVNGNYVAFAGGIIPKYAILSVNGDTATFELFTKWQGAWLPAIGSWDSEYDPQYLVKTGPNEFSNDAVNVKINAGKTYKVIGIARNTIAGKVKFKFEKVDRIPDKYLEIRKRALHLNVTQSTN